MGVFGKLFGGGKGAPPPPNIPPPPPLAEFMDVIDEITGATTTIVTGADGKKTRVVKRLPMTPQQKERYDLTYSLMKDSMDTILKLKEYGNDAVADYAPYLDLYTKLNEEQSRELGEVANIGNIREDINTFRQIQKQVLSDEFTNARRRTELDLSNRGRENSSYASGMRASLASSEAKANQAVDMEAQVYGEQLASDRLNRNAQAFGLNEQGRTSRLGVEEARYNLEDKRLHDIEANRQRSIQENKDLFNTGAGMRTEDENRIANSNVVGIADNTYNMQNNAQMNRYNADVNRQQANYGMQMSAYNNRPVKFGEQLRNIGMRAVGRYANNAIDNLNGGKKGGMS